MATNIDLDHLVALNDEIAGLVRAGVPLELGLKSWGRDLRGPLRKTVLSLAKSAEQGQGLGAALADPKLQIPTVYRAVVTAGLRSGRLPSALESLAENARRLKQLRGVVGLAMIYPLIVIIAAYFMLILLLTVVVPAIAQLYEGDPPRLMADLELVRQAIINGFPIPGTNLVFPWVIVPPIAILATAALWWRRTRRAVVIGAGAGSRWLSIIPVAGRAMSEARQASLSHLFGMMIEHGVPLGESLRLAAECSGNRKLSLTAAEVAMQMEQGQLPTSATLESAGLPPLLALLVSSGASQQTLSAMARHVTDNYRRRVERSAQWLRDWLPVWLVLLVGITVGLLYTLTFFLPFSEMLNSLSMPTGNNLRVLP